MTREQFVAKIKKLQNIAKENNHIHAEMVLSTLAMSMTVEQDEYLGRETSKIGVEIIERVVNNHLVQNN